MPLLRRRPVPPAVKTVPLPAGERRVSWALTAGGEPVVATGRSLLLPGDVRLRWHEIEHASWQRPRLAVLETAEVEGSGLRHVVELADEGDLPEAVHARVTASVAWSDHARLAPSGGVRVVGRRTPDRDDLLWQLVYDAGTDPGDPLVRAQAERLLEGARRTLG